MRVMSGGLKRKMSGKDNHLDRLKGNFNPLALQTQDPQFSWCIIWGAIPSVRGRNICLQASSTASSRHGLTDQSFRTSTCRINGQNINFTGSLIKIQKGFLDSSFKDTFWISTERFRWRKFTLKLWPWHFSTGIHLGLQWWMAYFDCNVYNQTEILLVVMILCLCHSKSPPSAAADALICVTSSIPCWLKLRARCLCRHHQTMRPKFVMG